MRQRLAAALFVVAIVDVSVGIALWFPGFFPGFQSLAGSLPEFVRSKGFAWFLLAGEMVLGWACLGFIALQRHHQRSLAELTAEAEPRASSSTTLPTWVQFGLIMLSPQRRNDVLNDIWDWYPGWVKGHGAFGAHLLCSFKVASAALWSLLDLAYRVAEIVGKFKSAK